MAALVLLSGAASATVIIVAIQPFPITGIYTHSPTTWSAGAGSVAWPRGAFGYTNGNVTLDVHTTASENGGGTWGSAGSEVGFKVLYTCLYPCATGLYNVGFSWNTSWWVQADVNCVGGSAISKTQINANVSLGSTLLATTTVVLGAASEPVPPARTGAITLKHAATGKTATLTSVPFTTGYVYVFQTSEWAYSYASCPNNSPGVLTAYSEDDSLRSGQSSLVMIELF
ncbi:MAG: hypothetical protein ACHQ2Y_00435 [Candidatus Lutacidiplasmatales archaeon]